MKRQLFLSFVFLIPMLSSAADIPHASTRIETVEDHLRVGPDSYPFREKLDTILAELDIHPGDFVADIGAGDGWWTQQFAEILDGTGAVYAMEVDEGKVDRLEDRFADTPVIKPKLTPTDHCGLPEDSCDMAFFSQVYHHLDQGGRVDYLKQLKTVVKPTGRLCIIEKYSRIASVRRDHGTNLSDLIVTAEKAGWIPVRYELLQGTNHYLAIFAQSDLFPGAAEPTESETSSGFKARTAEMSPILKDIVNHRAVLVDVREQKEWDAGHLEDAMLVPLSEIKEKKDDRSFINELKEKFPKDKPVYLHCRTGHRVQIAAPLLKEMGFEVTPLKQGYQELFDNGFAKAAE